jgi:hypothetical protein
MFPITTKGGGTCASFPDVCKTPAPPGPPLPIPYPNVSQCSSLKSSTGSKKTVIKGKAIVLKKSILGSSSGDEAGTLKGLVSNTNRGELKFTKGANSVKVEKSPVVYLTCPTQQNCSSGPANQPAGVNVAPGPNTNVVVLTAAGDALDAKAKRNTYHDAGQATTSNKGSRGVSNRASELGDSLKGKGKFSPNKASERLGDAGALNGVGGFAQSRGTSVVGTPQSFRGRSTVDMLAHLKDPAPGGALLVVEAKGGTGRLCSRVGERGIRYLQGTPGYLKSVAKSMIKSGVRTGNKAKEEAGKKLLKALKDKTPPVHYVEARTKYAVDKNGKVKAGDTEWKEFDP